jgi:Phage Tail Collar Domain
MDLPVGTVIAYMGLAGTWGKEWLLCDGGSYAIEDKTKLHRVLQFTYGSVSPGTFKVPDLQGYFLRGVTTDELRDPDYKSRTNPDPAHGTDLAPAGQVGSRQDQQLLNHEHKWKYHRHSISFHGEDISVQLTDDSWHPDGDMKDMLITNKDGGGNETRPKNVYVYYLIYAG